MKKIVIIVVLLALIATMFAACKKPDDPIVVEEELITTVKLNVTDSNNVTKTFIYKVENGFGSTTQGNVQIDTIMLQPGYLYSYSIEVLNESENPAEDITEEILEERDEHLFLFSSSPATGAGALMQNDGSKDNNNLPFNQTGKLQTGGAGHGMLTINLMHAPTDKNGTTPDASGGETDAQVTYHVMLQ